MMSDAIDDALDDDEAEDETEELTNQVISKSRKNVSLDIFASLSFFFPHR